MANMAQACDGAIWDGVDLTQCFEERYLDTVVPVTGLTLSAAALILQRASKRRRQRASARLIAQLDPGSSTFHQQQQQQQQQQHHHSGRRRKSAHGVLARALSTLLPYNGPRLASRLGFGQDAEREPLTRESRGAHADTTPSSSTAAQIVYRTENAVILNEVHRVMRDTMLNDAADEERRLASPQGFETVKRAWEAVGSAAAAGVQAVAVHRGQHRPGWLWVWLYLLCLSLYTLLYRPSYFKHKTLLLVAAFLVAVVELRSTVLDQSKSRADLVLAAVYTAFSTLTLAPSIFFPYETRLPIRLRAIRDTICAQLPFQEARTAIPTPQRRASPRSSDAHDTEGATEVKHDHTLVAAPENRASVFSRAFFGFVTPAVWKHYLVQFTLDAVPDLPHGSHAASVVAGFRAENDQTVSAKLSPVANGHEHYGATAQADGDDSEDGIDSDLRLPDEKSEQLIPSQRGLGIRLARHFVGLLLYQALMSTIESVAVLTPPVAMRLILTYIAQQSRGEASEPLHVALLYAGLLTGGGIVASVAASQALFTGRVICVRARAILLFEIINKALRRRDTGGGAALDDSSVKADGKNDSGEKQRSKRATDGEVTNYVAIDVFRVSEIGAYLHFIVPSTPIQIGLCIYLLVDLLGPAALVGVAVILLCMPVQAYAARLFAAVQKRTLEATDQRLNLATEVMACIKTVKFFAWEAPFEQRLDQSREKELKALRYRYAVWLLGYFLFLIVPTLVTITTFAVHTLYLHQPLPAEKAFTALALFNSLRSPLEALPDMVVNVLSAAVSLKRIDTFLREEETTKYEQLKPEENKKLDFIGFSKASFTFSEDANLEGAFCLRDLDIKFPPGELTIIAGPVGSGKTALLMSLLGEMRQLSGKVSMPCAVARSLVPTDPHTGLSETIAYCPQSPWLLGASIKENILFGQPYSEARYQATVKACALEPDFAILEYEDETEVGEKGTALSGGQKARVALARALYSPARYILLDDVLSAVDAHTAKHLYRHCLKGPLMRKRTVILVTHAISLCLPGCAMAIALQEGRVLAAGSAAEVQATGVFDDEFSASGTQTPTDGESVASVAEEDESPIVEELDEEARRQKIAEIKMKLDKKALHANIETYGKGNVGVSAYKLYLASFAGTAVGLFLYWVVYASLFAGARGMEVANAAWLREWAAKYDAIRGETASEDDRTKFYLGVYALVALAYVLVSIARDAVCVYGSLQASRRIYRRLMKSIVYARPQWFDRTPIGRIMNRLSKDVETIDQDIAPNFVFFVDVCLRTVVIMIVACTVLPAFTGIAFVVIILYGVVGSLYVVSSRDLKRLESVTRSPIFTLVGEVLSGAVVIRAFGDASRFTRHCLRLIDKTNRPFLFLWMENRWLSIRVDTLAVIVSGATATFLILNKNVDAALSGFVLSFTIQLVDAVLWVMRMYATLEISGNSVERVDEYLQVESERTKGNAAPAAWPSIKGDLVVENLSARYSPELPLVLKDVSFHVQAGEKIGICGRTGSGKSSLGLALFRFLEAEAGRIIVDGIDLSTIRLDDIRQRLTIIPQESQLFSGSVRFNLDPFGTYEDEVLWDALERCKLALPRQTRAIGPANAPLAKKTHLSDLKGKQEPTTGTTTPVEAPATAVVNSLDMEVEQGGKNFSAGQKQLLALARGLIKLRQSNIVLLDESTASLDAGSDAAIQRTIRAEMRDATLLVVAHRIRGIVTFDKVLVLGDGLVREFDRPSKLMRQEGSAFRELCLRSGEFDLLLRMADEADRERAAGLEPGVRTAV